MIYMPKNKHHQHLKSFLNVFVSCLVCLTCLLLTSSSLMAKEIIIINDTQGKSERHKYTQELLVAALDSTIASHGHYEFKPLANLNQPRTAAMLKYRGGYGDVVQGATRKEWEDNLIQIKIPLMKGILGLRVLFIHKSLQPTIANIDSLAQLKRLLGGAVSFWSITQIFEYHNFDIVKFNRQDSMYSMLERKRFDYVSRGINEVLIEFEQYKSDNPNLHIENNLLLHIPLPVYFFVNPAKKKLANRIEIGLNNIIDNGVFDTIFTKHFKEKFSQLNLLNRRLFSIKNPNLTSPYYSYKPEDFQTLFDNAN